MPDPVFTCVIAPADNFAGRSLTDFGIGEQIALSFTASEGTTYASFNFGLNWRIKTGSDLADLSSVNANGTATLTMRSTGGTVVVELTTVGPNPVVKCTKTIWVHEPTGLRMTRFPARNTYHRQNTASAGFIGQVHVQPANVSFSRCELREGSSTPVGTGSLSESVAQLAHDSSSDAQRTATQAELAQLRSGNVRHPILGAWCPIGGGNSATGCLANLQDTVESRTNALPIAAGTFQWDIPWLIRVAGRSEEKQVDTLVHAEAVTATGAMTISKKGTKLSDPGVTVTHQAADPSSDY